MDRHGSSPVCYALILVLILGQVDTLLYTVQGRKYSRKKIL